MIEIDIEIYDFRITVYDLGIAEFLYIKFNLAKNPCDISMTFHNACMFK